MAIKRLSLKVWKVTRRKSCAHGEAEFVKPKFPTVQAYTHRSIPEAVTR